MELFKPEDFYGGESILQKDDEAGIIPVVTRIANAKFREWVEGQPRVYGFDRLGLPWSPGRCPSDTHTARLVCIEEIKKGSAE